MKHLREHETAALVDEAIALEAAREAFTAVVRVRPIDRRVVGGRNEAKAEALAVRLPDRLEQTRTLGEFQHAPADAAVTELGAVLRGDAPGRTSPEQITVFDSSGFALQDLALACRILAAHEARA